MVDGCDDAGSSQPVPFREDPVRAQRCWMVSILQDALSVLGDGQWFQWCRTLSPMGLSLKFLAHLAIVDGLRCCRKLSATGPREGPLRIQRWPMVSTSTDALGICPTLVQVLCAFSDGPCSDVAGCSWQLAPHKDQRWSIVAMMPDALNKRPLAKFLCAFGNGQWF